MPTATSNPPKKLQTGKEYKIPHTMIVLKENIRGDAAKIDPKMYASIKENGVTSPLMVTPEYVHIDGERRYWCCDQLAKELGVPYIEVPVIVRDIPESQIPIYQFTLGYERKNISTADTNRAVYLHAERNPNVQLKELAELFHISKTSAFRCVRMQKAPILNKLVAEKKLTQNAALDVIDHFLSQVGADSEDFDEDATQQAMVQADELGKALEANISANEKVDSENKKIPQPAWNVRNINTYLNSIGKPPIEKKKSGEKSDNKKYNLPALVQAILDSFIISPVDDDRVSFNGTLSVEQFEALKELSQEKKKGELIEINNNNTDQTTYDTWKEYSDFYPSAIVIVQDSITRYRSYDGSMEIIEEVLKIEPKVIDGVKVVSIPKTNMRTVQTQLINKGWTVVRVNKEDAKSRLKSANQPKPSGNQPEPETVTSELISDTAIVDNQPKPSGNQHEPKIVASCSVFDTDIVDAEIKKELEAIVQAPSSTPVKTSKLQEKLNLAPTVITDEDEEFEILQNGSNYDEFIENLEDITDIED